MIEIILPDDVDGMQLGSDIWEKLGLTGTLHMERHRIVLDPETDLKSDKVQKVIPKKIRDKCVFNSIEQGKNQRQKKQSSKKEKGNSSEENEFIDDNDDTDEEM